MYNKRLLKFVEAHSGLFTAPEIAAIWKRSAWDVSNTALKLHVEKKLKIKQGILYAKS